MVFKTDKNFGTKVAYTLLSGRRNFRANFALVAQNRFYGLKRKLGGHAIGVLKEKMKFINSAKVLETLDFIIRGIPYFYGKI